MSTNIRGEFNNANPNRTNSAMQVIGFGSVINALIKGLTFTETAVVPSADKGVLANQPEFLLRVLATAETGTVHEKTLLIGPISGASAVAPAPGQCVWDGGKNILFNHVDAVTAFSALYTQTTDTTASIMQRQEGVSP